MLNQPPHCRRLRWPAILIVPLFLYLLFLIGWLTARTVLGDRWWWLFLLNIATPYLLLPLPLALLIALALRHWLSVALSVALLVPGLPILLDVWVPSFGDDPEFSKPAITVMTYNLYGGNDQSEPVIAAIRAAKADVVALQELNPVIAAVLRRDLVDEYPFQLLDPRAGVTGMGVISRWPLQPLATRLPGEHWVGTPQLVGITAPLGAVVLLNVHAIPPVGSPGWMTWAIGERERQVAAIVAVAREQHQPVIVAGDLNATPYNRTYHILGDGGLVDVWPQCGLDAGFTWPSAGQSVRGVSLPAWLVRIDYILMSPALMCTEAAVGQWDGLSDHRPVVARLVAR